MKLKLFTLFFFTCSFAFGQDYKSIITEAEKLYGNKEYQKSATKYKEAFKIEQKNAVDLYNAGCSAALSGDGKMALEWLNLAMKNGWTNLKHLKTDTDLSSLHNNKEWDRLLEEMQKEVHRVEADYDKHLQTKLLAIFDDDQIIRQQYIAAKQEFGQQSKQVDSLGRIMIFKDSINLIQVTGILDKYGWVGADKIGSRANQTLFLVIQHSDLKTQEKYLPMMREAVKNKKADPASLALLEDRVLLGQGKRQIYGSQIGYYPETNEYYVQPLNDPDNVDKLRAEVGLGSIADYIKHWGIIWDAESYKKQLPLIEEKQKHKN